MYKPLTDFRSEEPTASDLRRLQNAVVSAFTDLDDERLVRARHIRGTGSLNAEYDQAIEMLASGTVVLPPLLPERNGRRVSVILTTAGLTVVVRAVDGALVQGGASESHTTLGKYEYVCGVTGWYR